MTGQRYFPNGTGTAYFDDGSTIPFNHSITPQNGYYYDDSTVFTYGQIPGYEANQTIWELNMQATELGVTGDVINVTIANGAALLGERAIQPSNIIHAKVGDVIMWTNEDFEYHTIASPPWTSESHVPDGENFEISLGPGESMPLLVTKTVGMHFGESYSDIKGAIIVEER
jgi:hypothetical protein